MSGKVSHFSQTHTLIFHFVDLLFGGYSGFGWLDSTGWISFPVSRPRVLALKGTESTTDGNRRKSPTSFILSSSTNWLI